MEPRRDDADLLKNAAQHMTVSFDQGPLPDSPDEKYFSLLARYTAELAQSRKRVAATALAHQITICVCIACLVAGYLCSVSLAYLAVGIALSLVAEVILYTTQRYLHHHSVFSQDMVRINRHAIARRQRDWDSIPDIVLDDPELEESELAKDLDIFGQASLLKLVCTAETPDGTSKLGHWLAYPPNCIVETTNRQRAVAVLSHRLSWRQEFQRLCGLVSDNGEQVEQLKTWAAKQSDRDGTESYGASDVPSFALKYAIALRLFPPVLVLVLFLSPPVGTLFFGVVLCINIVMTIVFSGRVQSLFSRILVTPDAPSFSVYSNAFSHIVEADWLRDSWQPAAEISDEPIRGMRSLERVFRFASVSRHASTFAFVYLPLQFILLWDLQTYLFAARWRKSFGDKLASWFEMLGEVESLSSFASVKYDQPDWVLPTFIDSRQPSFVAEGLGHPLLADENRVTNSIEVGPPGRLQIVTGSNMGGKSTLLRAIGINALLAQAGAPCCCKRLSLTNLHVMTSVKVVDSLLESKSFFLVQLLNLKRIVDEVNEVEVNKTKTPVIYLLDEILSGTNTTDRRVAVEGLIGHLLRHRTIGVMTTHDIQIVSESKFRNRFDAFYLCHQSLGDSSSDELKYDYLLRSGVAPTSNALVLFRLLGLPT